MSTRRACRANHFTPPPCGGETSGARSVRSGGQRALNFVQDTIDISQHVVVPEAQDAIAGRFDAVRSRSIRCLLPIMLPAVEFDDELGFAAHEIDNERTYRGLAPEMRAAQCDVMTEPMPKHALGFGGLCAHAARELSLTIVHRERFKHTGLHLWTPTPDPSPQGGGEKSPQGEGEDP